MSAFPINPALEAAVIANADEDTPRLVYADWLDENGDPDRAEFIRVQCRLADMLPDDPDWCELEERQHELVARMTHRLPQLRQNVPSPPFYWGNYPPDVVLQRQFHRGFPFWVYCQGSDWGPAEREQVAADLDRLVATSTYRDLDFHWIPPDRFGELFDNPAFAQLRGLSFRFAHGGGRYEEDAVAACMKLIQSPVVRNLRRLDLNTFRGTAIDMLARAESFRNLRWLKLPGWMAPTEDMQRLLAGNWAQGVQHLSLGLGTMENSEAMLAGAGQLPALHTLELQFPGERAGHLAAGRFPRLVALKCPGAMIRLRGVQSLLQADWFARLRVLDLTSNDLGDKTVVAMARHPVAKSLRVLRLGNNPFGRGGLSALSQPGAFPELIHLDLSLSNPTHRKANEGDLAAFLSALTLPRLRHLDLSGLPVGDRGVGALATNPAYAGLKTLRLKDCRIGESGLQALQTADHLQQATIVT